MIQVGSRLRVIDNSGVMWVRCIKILGRCRKSLSGERLVVSVRKVKPHRKARQGSKMRCLVAGTGSLTARPDGSYIRFGRSCVIMLDRRGSPLGRRVRGPVQKEFKEKVVVRTLGVLVKTVQCNAIAKVLSVGFAEGYR